jgi:AbrB family looped-hinge helix DNA binding protein
MLVSIDKRGSIVLPAGLRKELQLKTGSYLDMEVLEGGRIVLNPVSIYRTVRLNATGLEKLEEARKSGTGEFPDWMVEELKDAQTDTVQ